MHHTPCFHTYPKYGIVKSKYFSSRLSSNINMIKKILVIQTASIGDAILGTAVIEKLHSYHPDAKIDYLVKKGIEPILSNHPFLNNTLVWNKKEKKNRNLIKLLCDIRKTKYDLVITLQRFFSSGLLTVFSGAKITAGFDKNPLSFFFTIKSKI